METRTALLDTAEHLARTKWFDAFSYADLAHRVGIRKASVHHHFPAKADLAAQLLSRYIDRFTENLATLDACPNGAARIIGYLDLYRAALEGGAQLCLCVACSAGRDSFSDQITATLAQFHDDSAAWLSRAYALGQIDRSIPHVHDPEAEAAATLALVEGAQVIARAAASITPFDTATAALRARLAASLT